ncbi:hypothetical protein ACJ3XI_08745 [Litorimonas sp. RW-G-Af-16]|uniref:hypothetical protein n=1 Tax=Litorimonas sp. RW-G-Af-16 TaxID=3241168 RepID=UPI00390C97EA
MAVKLLHSANLLLEVNALRSFTIRTLKDDPMQKLPATFLGLCALAMSGQVFAQDFDIAGVKLGMTPEQAEAAVTDKGFEQKGGPYGPYIVNGISFEQSVKEKLGEDLPRRPRGAIAAMLFAKGEREEVSISFLSYPSGEYVNGVNYFIFDDTLTQDVFFKKAISKYGEAEPEPLRNGGQIWIGEPEMSIDGIQSSESLESEGSDGDYSLTLSQEINNDDFQAALKKAVDAALPKSKKPVETSF